MIGDAAQHVGEPSLGIYAVEFCRGGQGVDRRRALPWSEPAKSRARGQRASAIGKSTADLCMISSHIKRPIEPFWLHTYGAIKAKIESGGMVNTFLTGF